MVVYSAIVSILLVIFVALYSASAFDAGKWESMSAALTGSRTVFSRPGAEEAHAGPKAAEDVFLPEAVARFDPATPWENFAFSMRDYMDSNALMSSLAVEMTDTGMVIHLPDSVLFDTGVSALRTDGQIILAGLLRQIDKSREAVSKIDIQGHTDDRPISTARFADNWELSQGRSMSVLRYLLSIETDPSAALMYSVGGYADTRPIASNETEEGREMNRRVDIVLTPARMPGTV